MLRAPQWMLRAPQWMLRAPPWMLRARRAVCSAGTFRAPAKSWGGVEFRGGKRSTRLNVRVEPLKVRSNSSRHNPPP
eukprot:5356084-Pyramimonas_sp.AAC.1